MFKIFGFGRKAPVAHLEKQAHDTGATTRQHNDIQRELVRVVLNDILRVHGIPADWFTCNVTALSGRARSDDILVRLVVLKWHEPLLKYLPVLQQHLIAGLDRFEPAIDHSKYIVSWQFSPECGCPHRQLPDAGTWTMPGTTSAPDAAAPTTSIVNWQPDWTARSESPGAKPAPAKPKFDLPDRPVKATADTFAATTPTPLAQTPAAVPAGKAKFDLPLSEKDAMPSTFAATEPSPLR